jgi:hypothetical protein
MSLSPERIIKEPDLDRTATGTEIGPGPDLDTDWDRIWIGSGPVKDRPRAEPVPDLDRTWFGPVPDLELTWIESGWLVWI